MAIPNAAPSIREPIPHAQEARVLRGCRNCLFWARDTKCPRGGWCRRHAPSSAPGAPAWPPCGPNDWCGEWTWFIEPRVEYAAGIAGREKMGLEVDAEALVQPAQQDPSGQQLDPGLDREDRSCAGNGKDCPYCQNEACAVCGPPGNRPDCNCDHDARHGWG